ncbi:hypothetical protein NMG60_11005439 [Bertholletia excelsa]
MSDVRRNFRSPFSVVSLSDSCSIGPIYFGLFFPDVRRSSWSRLGRPSAEKPSTVFCLAVGARRMQQTQIVIPVPFLAPDALHFSSGSGHPGSAQAGDPGPHAQARPVLVRAGLWALPDLPGWVRLKHGPHLNPLLTQEVFMG